MPGPGPVKPDDGNHLPDSVGVDPSQVPSFLREGLDNNGFGVKPSQTPSFMHPSGGD